MRHFVGLLIAVSALIILAVLKVDFREDGLCEVSVIESKIIGTSLEPFLADGSTVQALKDYYSCHAIQKGDMVIFKIGSDALIKIVKGLPGEQFLLQKDETELWNIIINGEKVKNSEGMPYAFNEDHYRILHRNETAYTNIIPEGAYLLLGDWPEGTDDSSVFGFIGKNNIIGKVETTHAD